MNSEYEKIKLNRCYYYERDRISLITKKEVAKKTDNKCAICGKHIMPGGDDFTIDHFIPLSKGGKNDIINLIPLCEDCNKNKGEDVTKVTNKYPFLKNKHKEELKELTEKYLNEYNWVESTNFLTYDDQVVKLPIYGYRRYIKGKIKTITIDTPVRIRKVRKLTDDILDFVTEYNSFFNYGTDFLKRELEDLIEDGRLYVVTKDKEDNIRFVIYFKTAEKIIDWDNEYFGGKELNRDLKNTTDLLPPIDEVSEKYIEDNKDSIYNIVAIGNIIGKPVQNETTNWTKAALINILARDMINSAIILGMKTFSISVETDIPTIKLYNDFREQLRAQLGTEPQFIGGVEEQGQFVMLHYDFDISGDKNFLNSLSEDEYKKIVTEDLITWHKQLNLGKKKKKESE